MVTILTEHTRSRNMEASFKENIKNIVTQVVTVYMVTGGHF